MSTFTMPRVYGPAFKTRLNLMGIRFANDDAGGTGAGAGDPDAGELTADEIAALGDPGKQAIDRMKGVVQATKAELKAYADLGLSAADIKAMVEASRAPKVEEKPVDESAIEKRIREAIEAESNSKSDARSRAAEVRAQAAELDFIKPMQALALLDQAKLAAVKVDPATGDADAASVKALLEDLAKDSPHLLKPTDTTPGHKQVGIGGTGSGTTPDVQPGAARIRNAYENSAKK